LEIIYFKHFRNSSLLPFHFFTGPQKEAYSIGIHLNIQPALLCRITHPQKVDLFAKPFSKNKKKGASRADAP
jgi:hypothetical protein